MKSTVPVKHWRLRTRQLTIGRMPLLMGILNVTPDSFSDGGRFFAREDAVRQGMMLVEQGADLLDIGGESTRPYATPVSADDELRRICPVIAALRRQTHVPISVDTSKASVAQAALDEGAEIVNDVTGLNGDPRMVDVVQRTGAGVCVMHMRGTPATMQDNPHYENVVQEVARYLHDRRDQLVARGVTQDRICLDPGIGFGKSTRHNLAILTHIGHFIELQCPVLIGHSRKGFIGRVLEDEQADPTAGTIGVALAVAAQGATILRVHDVQPVRHALRLFAACGGLAPDGS